MVHLFLRVDIAQQTSVVPPLWRCLHEDSVRVDGFDQFLSSLSKHRRLVAGANQEDFLFIELLRQMQQSRLEDRVSVSHTVVSRRLEVSRALKDMDWESRSSFWPDHAFIHASIPVRSNRHVNL